MRFMDKTEVLKLAKLARIHISEEEADTLSHEFEGILNYVGEIKEAVKTAPLTQRDPNILQNIMRADEAGHEAGLHTEVLLVEAPDREEDFVRVKKIL